VEKPSAYYTHETIKSVEIFNNLTIFGPKIKTSHSLTIAQLSVIKFKQPEKDIYSKILLATSRYLTKRYLTKFKLTKLKLTKLS